MLLSGPNIYTCTCLQGGVYFARHFIVKPIPENPKARYFIRLRLAPVSNVNCFCKTDNLSKIAIYKLYLEVEVLGLDITNYQRGYF